MISTNNHNNIQKNDINNKEIIFVEYNNKNNNNNKELEKLNNDIQQIYMIYEELIYYINKHDEHITLIDNLVIESKLSIEFGKNELTIAKNTQHSGSLGFFENITGSLIGASIGTIFYIYNPHIIIVTIIGGGLIGWYTTKIINNNI